MPLKQELEVNELTDVKVEYVSLVKRGANRVPFKIIKSEDNPMTIDLYNIFKREPLTPVVAAIIVNKNADLAKAKARIKAAGFSIEKAEDKEDTVVFAQVEGDLQNVVAVKFDEDVAVLVANVTKGFDPNNFESVSFQDMMKQEGFYASIGSAREVLSYTIDNIMKASDSGEDAASKIATAVEDFGKYVTGLVSSIPVVAFKLEDADVIKHADGPADDTVGTETPSTEEAAGETGEDDDVDREGTEGEGDGNAEAEGTEANTEGEGEGEAGEGSEEVAKSDSDAVLKGVTDILANFRTEITEQITGVSEGVKKMQGDLDAMATRVTSVEAIAKSAEEAVTGTVGGAANDDPVKKGEGAPALAVIDTGYAQ